MLRTVGATLVALCLTTHLGGHAGAAPKITMWQTQDSAVTEGFVDVQAAPVEIYAVLTDYTKWTALFSDIEWVKHKSGGREDAVLECKSRTYGKHAQHFRFRNRRQKLVHFAMDDGPPGVKLWQQITFEPREDSGLTRVRIRMHISVGGVLGWLTTEAKVKKYRDRKVHRDLVDLGKRWEPRPKPSSAGD
jgi:hypothetical protein